MKKSLIYIVSFIIILSISIGSFMFFQSRSKSEEYNKIDNNNINEKENNSSDEISDVNETDLIVEENNSKQETIKENNTVIQDNNINSSVDEKKNNNSSNQEKESNNKKEDSNTNQESKPAQNSKPEEKVEEIKKEPTAWEELGISESDYYNKPMWSWARIDFSIDKYKTYEKTREACITKGEEYYEQGYGYSCTGINSYSGRYLGEMLKTF